jgi:signal-transduction protein with cAMP-binding, CBS, and nucleotidyltransferase domain
MKEIVKFKEARILEKLAKKFNYCTYVFPYKFSFVTRGQVPPAVLIVLHGVVNLVNSKGKKVALESGNVFGESLLKENIPSPWACVVESNSRVLLVEKKDLIQLDSLLS